MKTSEKQGTSFAEDLSLWVENKPIIIMRFDATYSELLYERNKFERFTFAQPHSTVDNFKLPTLCLVEMRKHDSVSCYVGVVKSKRAVTHFDSRITLIKLRQIIPSSLKELNKRITEKRFSSDFSGKLPQDHITSVLSPKLSAHIVKLLSNERNNQNALETVIAQLPGFRPVSNVNWAQENAIQTAMAAFGLKPSILSVTVKKGATSTFSLFPDCVLEDNVIGKDASVIPGFSLIEKDITGRAVFMKRGERLEVYTANRGPLEKMLGVDLIYVNATRGNIVMVQYKMLEQENNHDWVFRPDKQTKKEIARMKLPKIESIIDDYRLSRDPFYFKFVKRKIVDGSHKSFLISLEHLNQMFASPTKAKGSKGGIRLSYDALDGTYLRESDIVSLIRSGYIGTHRVESDVLKTIISEVSKGNKAIVLAWQRKIQEGEES